MANGNFLLVSQNAMSHLNPTLNFATNLLSMGAKATLLVALSAAQGIKDQLPAGLSLETFSDGYDAGIKFNEAEQWASEFERRGRQALRDLISSSSKQGHPFTCIVHTLLIPWVVDTAAEVQVPTAALWIQSATVFYIFYYYFNGFGDLIKDNKDNPLFSIQFPELPLLKNSDLPSFIFSEQHSVILKGFERRFKVLEKETNLPILINTFDPLEQNAIMGIGKVNVIPIGPLGSFGETNSLDQTQKKDYIKWLDSKPDSSVVYVAFGSISSLPKNQIEEIANGLLESGYSFLWVLRLGEELRFLNGLVEAHDQGKIVPWCMQMEVLNHASVGCFISHCGWNSTLESVVAGVPVIGFPLWADQRTNAKMVEDVWKNGVKVKKSDDEGMVEGKEIVKCLKIVMGGGERGEEIRMNAGKFKCLAKEAANGASDLNLKSFVGKICGGN